MKYGKPAEYRRWLKRVEPEDYVPRQQKLDKLVYVEIRQGEAGLEISPFEKCPLCGDESLVDRAGPRKFCHHCNSSIFFEPSMTTVAWSSEAGGYV